MGRLAGSSVDAWKRQVKFYRSEKAKASRLLHPAAPIVHPAARRRQMALLWYIRQYFPEGMIIGARGLPPLTSDMRALMSRRYLALRRDHRHLNKISVTDGGLSALAESEPKPEDKSYIIASALNQSVR